MHLQQVNPQPKRILHPLMAGGGVVLLVGLLFLLGGSSRPESIAHADEAAHKEAFKDLVPAWVNLVPGALTTVSHRGYNRTSFYRQDTHHLRQGTMVILGNDGNRLVGLTTQCAVNFKFPNYSLIKGAASGEPTFTAGILSLTLPGGNAASNYLVARETDWTYLQDPSGGFDAFIDSTFPEPPHVREEFPAAWVESAIHFDKLRQWHALRREKPMVEVEPLGNHDLALVYFPAIPGIRTLGLEKPREKILALLKEMPFSSMLGREFFVRCEECTALVEGHPIAQTPTYVTLLRFARLACLLLAPQFSPAIGIAAGAGEMLPAILDAVEDLSRGMHGVEDLNKLTAAGMLGTMLDLTDQELEIVSGHLILVKDYRLRLAHIRAKNSDAKEALSKLIEVARKQRHHVFAVIERSTYNGEAITHLIVPETHTYLNLSLVQSGSAGPYEHREALKTAKLFSLMRLQEKLVMN